MKNKNGWVGLTPCENLKSCCISKPPLVLFTVGLLILTAAFFYLAQYVMDNKLIEDPNYSTDWETFLTDLDSMTWSTTSKCAAKLDKHLKAGTNMSNEISVVVNVESTLEIKDGYSYEAILWKESILPKEKLDKHKHVSVVSYSRSYSLDGGNTSVSEGGKDQPLCMTIRSKGPFLPSKLKKPETCKPEVPVTKKALYLCDKPSKAPHFKVVYKAKGHPFKMYLTYDDRMNIHIHLMSTSYFLMVVATTVLLYGLIKRRIHSTSSDMTTPLATSEV